MSARSTPTLANWLLKLFCSGVEYDSVIGDLTEQYETGRGGFWYWRQVLSISLLGLRRKVAHRPLIPQKNFPVGLAFTFVLIVVALATVLSSDAWMIFLAAILAGVFVAGVKVMVDTEDKKIIPRSSPHVARIDSSKIPIGGGASTGIIILVIFGAAFHDQPMLRWLAIPGLVAGLLFAMILRLWRRHHEPEPLLTSLHLKDSRDPGRSNH